MSDPHVTRREFVQTSATTAAAATVGLSLAPGIGQAKEVPAEIKKTRSYNPDMPSVTPHYEQLPGGPAESGAVTLRRWRIHCIT